MMPASTPGNNKNLLLLGPLGRAAGPMWTAAAAPPRVSVGGRPEHGGSGGNGRGPAGWPRPRSECRKVFGERGPDGAATDGGQLCDSCWRLR